MIKKLLITFIFLLPFGARCDQPVQVETTKLRAAMGAASNNISQEEHEAARIEHDEVRATGIDLCTGGYSY